MHHVSIHVFLLYNNFKFKFKFINDYLFPCIVESIREELQIIRVLLAESDHRQAESDRRQEESDRRQEESDRQILRLTRSSIILNIYREETNCLKNLSALKEFLKDYDLQKSSNDGPSELYKRYLARYDRRVSSVIEMIQSSIGGPNCMSTFRFNRMFKAADKSFRKIRFDQRQVINIITTKLFDCDFVRYEEYMNEALNDLKFVRAIFECYHQYNDPPVIEISQFQPIFLTFLDNLMEKLNPRVSPASASLSSLSSSSPNDLQFYASAANRLNLHFTAECCTTDANKGKFEKISGHTDVVVSRTESFDCDKSIVCMFEIKAPGSLAVASNIVGPKNQTCAQLRGLQNLYCPTGATCLPTSASEHVPTAFLATAATNTLASVDFTEVFIPKACLTDLFSLYSTFLFQGDYYISESVLEPRTYLEYLLLQMCHLTSEDMKALIKASEVETEVEILDDDGTSLIPAKNTNAIVNPNQQSDCSAHSQPKIPSSLMKVTNYKLEEEIELYNEQVAALYRWENEVKGYEHLNKENLEKFNSISNNNYALSRFLCTNDL